MTLAVLFMILMVAHVNAGDKLARAILVNPHLCYERTVVWRPGGECAARRTSRRDHKPTRRMAGSKMERPERVHTGG